MMDGFFQAVPPEDFFRHRDFRPIVMDSLRSNEKPFLALLAAPGEWDVAAHPVLPLYAAFKTNSKDNAEMPTSQWQLVFTAPGREEAVILPWDESDKTPPAAHSGPTPPPPGSKPKVTYSFDQDWRDVDYGALAQAPKVWKVVLHAGNFLSNPVTLKIKNGKPDPVVVTPVQPIKKTPTDYPEAKRKQFARTPSHPAAPEKGVVFGKALGQGIPERPGLILAGAFAFPAPASESEFLTLQLFFTGDDLPKGLRITLSVPIALLQLQGKNLQGCFSVDLRPYFSNSTGKLLAPKSLFVTPIRGEYIGEPHRIELPQTK